MDNRNSEYSVYSSFNMDLHKQTYVNYLEAIILPDGTVEYAVPSHQEKLIQIYMRQNRCSKKELLAECPSEYYFDFLTWLTMRTGCISVWTDMVSAYTVTRKQRNTLRKLKINGLYKGPVPSTTAGA